MQCIVHLVHCAMLLSLWFLVLVLFLGIFVCEILDSAIFWHRQNSHASAAPKGLSFLRSRRFDVYAMHMYPSTVDYTIIFYITDVFMWYVSHQINCKIFWRSCSIHRHTTTPPLLHRRRDCCWLLIDVLFSSVRMKKIFLKFFSIPSSAEMAGVSARKGGGNARVPIIL